MKKLIVILGAAILLILISSLKGSVSMAQTATGPVTVSNQLALPASAYPGDYKQTDSEAWPVSKADSSSFAGLHGRPYSALGLQGAWYQYAAKIIFSTAGNVTIAAPVEAVYLGTYYTDAAAAGNAYADITATSSVTNPVPCSYGTRCVTYTILLPFNGVTYPGMVRVIQQGNAVAEIRVDTAQIVADQVSASTFVTNLNGVSQAFVTTIGALQPASTPTSAPTTAPTQTPVPPTPTTTPIPPTATSTSTATSTPTSTPIPLFVTVRLGHKTVKIGAKQTVNVSTLAGAGVSVGVSLPDGSKKHHAGTAGGDGTYAWTYTQPRNRKSISSRTVKITVTVTSGNSQPMTSIVTYLTKST